MFGWALFQTATDLSRPFTHDQKLRWITGPLAADGGTAAEVAGADELEEAAAVEAVAADVVAELAAGAAEVTAAEVGPAAEELEAVDGVLLDEPQATTPSAVIARPLARRRRAAVCL